MEVIRSNMLDMVKVLIYATDDRAVWETKDDTDADLERKLEELTPSNNRYEEPSGHVMKVIPTKKPTTFHHW